MPGVADDSVPVPLRKVQLLAAFPMETGMNTKSIQTLAVLLLALAAASQAYAQDPAVDAPDFYKCT